MPRRWASGERAECGGTLRRAARLHELVEARAADRRERGVAGDFGPGEAFVIDAGFRGTWESIGRVTKIYAILEPEGGD